MSVEEAPVAPGSAEIRVLFPDGLEGTPGTRVTATYVADAGLAFVAVCSRVDVVLVLRGQDSTPTRGSVGIGDDWTSGNVAPLRVPVDPSGKDVAFAVPTDLQAGVPGQGVPLAAPECRTLKIPAQGWIVDRKGAVSDVRLPVVSTCAGRTDEQRVDPPQWGTWTFRSSGDCPEWLPRVDFGATGRIVWSSRDASAPDPLDAGVRSRVAAFEADTEVVVESPQRAAKINADRVRFGVLLGVGITLAVEGALGVVNGVAGWFDRRRRRLRGNQEPVDEAEI